MTFRHRLTLTKIGGRHISEAFWWFLVSKLNDRCTTIIALWEARFFPNLISFAVQKRSLTLTRHYWIMLQSFMRAVSIFLCGRPNTANPRPNRKRKNIFKALIKEPFYIAPKPQTKTKPKLANGNPKEQMVYSIYCSYGCTIIYK